MYNCPVSRCIDQWACNDSIIYEGSIWSSCLCHSLRFCILCCIMFCVHTDVMDVLKVVQQLRDLAADPQNRATIVRVSMLCIVTSLLYLIECIISKPF